MRRAALSLILAAWPGLAGQPLAYTEGATHLTGYLARPAKVAGKVPGIVIVHQWMGLTKHERDTADRLAQLGYIALAADIYGDGVVPKDTKEAGALAGKYKGDRGLYQRRIRAALETLEGQAKVDPERLAVIGFCFGGTGALEAARAGFPVKGVVSFHGGLDSQAGRRAQPIVLAPRIAVAEDEDAPFARR